MRRDVNSNEGTKHPLHHRRGFAALVVSAAFALVIGLGAFGLHSASMSPNTDPGKASEATGSLPADGLAEGEEKPSFHVSNDPQYGDIETGKVLVHVDESTDLNGINSVLQGLDITKTKDVSGQDASIGFVEVEVDDSASMSEIMSAFENEGLSAQPNYVYYIAESFDSTVESFETSSIYSTDESALDTQSEVRTDDPEIGKQWMLDSVNAYRAWGIERVGEEDDGTKRDNPVSVAVIDTGIKVDHEDLVPNLRATYRTPVNADSTGSTERDAVADSDGHGTHVSGIATGVANNGVGIAGVSYNAGLVAIKATSTNSGRSFNTETLSYAYEWLFDANAENPAKTNAEFYNVRVINMSVGGVRESDFSKDKILAPKIKAAYLGQSGEKSFPSIVTVAAAGNSDQKNLSGEIVPPPYDVIPGDYEYCLTVINLEKGPGWTSAHNVVSRSSTSNYNTPGTRFKNISAPGNGILSTVMSGGYETMSGTSMASPLVAGVAALIISEDSSLNAGQVTDVIETTARDIGPIGWDEETGYGEVDAYHALQVLSAEIALGDVSCGESVELALSCADGSSTPASEWTWTSSDPGVLAVDTATGTVKANMRGTVTLTATHPCGREISKELSVGAVDLSDVQIAPIDDLLYTGVAIEPTISVSLDGRDLVLGTDYTVSFSNNVNVGGAATVTVSGIGNYTGTATDTFAILPRSLDEASVQSVDSQIWNGSALTPVPVVRFDSRTLVNGRDFDVVYENNKDAGTARFVITGKGNYTGVIDGEFVIEPRDLSSASVRIASQTYTGRPIEPDAVVTLGGVTLVKGTDYIIQYSNNTNAGNATASITGIGNYAGAKDVLFTISGGALSPLMITINNTPVYSGSEVRPGITVRADDGTVLKEHVDYVITDYGSNVNAGNNTAYVYVRGKGSYTGDVRASFTIRQASLANATVGVATQKYTGSQLKPEPTVTLKGYGTLVKGRDYTVSYGENTKVGTGSVTIIGTGNYTGSRKAPFVIEANSSSQSTQQNQGSSSSSSTTQKPSQPAGQQSAVTGSWVYAGRWWFSYDAATQRARGKRYPAGEWVTIGGKRYHFDAGGWMHAGWLQLGGKWYWLSSDGAMRTGWHLLGSTWYYMGTDGVMWTGKQRIGNATYFLDSSGAMRTGWNLEGNTWFLYGSSGAMAKGWALVGGRWYFLDRSSGAMRQYWLEPGDGQRYFLLSSGAMVTGWARVDGTWYHFGPSGAMQRGRWVGNYYVGADGRMATNAWIGRYHVNASGLWDATR